MIKLGLYTINRGTYPIGEFTLSERNELKGIPPPQPPAQGSNRTGSEIEVVSKSLFDNPIQISMQLPSQKVREIK